MSDRPSSLKRFWEDLKRRRVVRVAIGYAIGAWALVEVADILLPTFGAPDWVFRAVIAGAALGFPVTVILAWVFDISGRGVVVTEEAGFRLPTWVKTVVALPLIALVGVAGWWVWSGYVTEKESSVRPTDLAGQVPIVAVLPIRNVTGNPELDWYSEGLANLVRDNLTRSRYLRVVSPQKWKTIVGAASDEAEIMARSGEEGIGFVLGGEMLTTPGGILVTSRLTDTEGGVVLSSKQVENLSPETLLTAAGPIATQVKQGLNVPRAEQVDVFAADFATSNLAAYESYVAGLGFFLDYRYTQAEQAFRAALQLAPDFAVARYRLAYIQAVTGRTEQALANVQQALDSPYLGDRETRYIQAAQALFGRDYALAAGHYEALLEEYPFEIEARELLAKAYWGQYRGEEAVRVLERLAAEEPQNQVIWSTLGAYLLELGEAGRAQAALQRYAQLAPDSANSAALLGDSLRHQGKFEEARDQYRRAMEIDPGLREVPASIATLAYLEGDVVRAEEGFRAIVENESLIIRERLDALFPLVALLAARGDFAGAIDWLERFAEALREERIREAMAVSLQALMRLEMGDAAAARELAAAAIKLSPGVPTRYLFARGLIELATGDHAGVARTATEIRGHALPPDNPDRTEEKAAAYLEGLSLLARGQAAEARPLLEAARDLEGYRYVIYQYALARWHLLEGEASEGLGLVDSGRAIDPADPRIDLERERVGGLLLAAEIHAAEGDAASAEQQAGRFLERFDKADPSHPDVVRARDIVNTARMVRRGANPPMKKGSALAALSH